MKKMKNLPVVFLLALALAAYAEAPAFASSVVRKNQAGGEASSVAGRTIPVTEAPGGTVGAAESVRNEGNVAGSPYYAAPDYYNGNVTSTLLILPHFQTYQQTSEWSCGAASVLMGMNRLGVRDVSEAGLDREMDGRYYDNPRADGSYGTATEAIAKAFADRGFSVQSSPDTADEEEISFPEVSDFISFIRQNLGEGNLIFTENVEWGGHWMVLIGYDSMGTEYTGDDVLVFADPYDTTDHLQDGYLTRSLERYYYTWYDHNILPPAERIQQYVLVKKAA